MTPVMTLYRCTFLSQFFSGPPDPLNLDFCEKVANETNRGGRSFDHPLPAVAPSGGRERGRQLPDVRSGGLATFTRCGSKRTNELDGFKIAQKFCRVI